MGKKLIIKGADFSANAISEEIDITSLFTWTQYKYIAVADGSENTSSSQNSYASGYVDISAYTRINITLPEMHVEAVIGACFYDSSHVAIMPTMGGGIVPQPGRMQPYTFDVPSNAKYIRATKREDLGTFACYGYIDE